MPVVRGAGMRWELPGAPDVGTDCAPGAFGFFITMVARGFPVGPALAPLPDAGRCTAWSDGGLAM